MKSSLFAISMLAIGASFAGQAMAGQYSETASQRIAEQNRAAAEPLVPGVFTQEPAIPDAETLNAMVHYDPSMAQQSASGGSNSIKLENGGDVNSSNPSDQD